MCGRIGFPAKGEKHRPTGLGRADGCWMGGDPESHARLLIGLLSPQLIILATMNSHALLMRPTLADSAH